ncbi:MAG: (2Fe-2S)-binding protein [Acidimicrobiales bacterium]
MFVCQCRAVTDAAVRRAIAAGAHDPDEVSRRCGAGSGCGGCRPYVVALIAQWRDQLGHEQVIRRVVLGVEESAA